MRRLLPLGLLLAAACTGTIGSKSTTGSTTVDAGCVKNDNDRVRLALTGTCGSCHSAGSFPFFASLATFEATLVYNTQWVTPGHPESSALIALLHGQGSGTFTQMPPGESYQALEARGAAPMPLADLEAWVTNLQPQGTSYQGPNPDAVTIRRLTAEEMTASLMQQLGLDTSDFVYIGSNTNWRNEPLQVSGGTFFVYPPDRAPTVSTSYGSDQESMRRFEALGGPSTLNYRARTRELSPAALQVIVQMSQVWCSRAIAKPGNTTFFSAAAKTDTSAGAPDKVKKNIAALWLSMLGEPPADDQVTDLFTSVFQRYEPKGTGPAWTAVCSALMRHPKWLTF